MTERPDLAALVAAVEAAQEALAEHLQRLAQDILDTRPDVESVICAQGLDYIRGTDGREIPPATFPEYLAALEAWESLFSFDPGVYAVRARGAF